MDTTDFTKVALRRSLLAMGIGQAYASELTAGKKRPSLDLAAKIQAELGIPASTWTDGTFIKAFWEHLIATGSIT